MAHRLLVRRIWTLSAKDIRCLRTSTAATASSSFSNSLQSTTPRVSFLSPSRTLPRSLPHTSRREVSFNVQDHEDFTERVINSELPVLIDFHAQWVPQGDLFLWFQIILFYKYDQIKNLSTTNNIILHFTWITHQ